MAYRRKSYTYSGGDAIFPIPFDFIEENDIFVYIDNEPTTDFIIENHQVKLTVIPQELPVTVLVESKTDIDAPIVEWQNTSSLDEENLTLSNNQLLYAQQELYDGLDRFVEIANNVESSLQQINEGVDIVNEKTEDASEYAQLAKNWANKTDSTVDDTEYSSKYYAQQTASTAETALTNISNAKEEALDEIEETKEELLSIANTLQYKWNMFDLVTKDHVLTFEESKGFGLQGTYVYKEAVTGSRYGYPDFYNKCVEEKTASVNTTILTTPNVTNQGCYISRDYIVDGFSTRNYVQPSTGFNPESNPWEIVIKFTTGSSFNNYQGLMGSTDSAHNNGLRTIIDANGSLFYYGSSNNSSPNLMDAVKSTINLAINTTYYLKAEYTGTQYIFSFSTNGETYTPDTTVSQTTPVSIRSFCFGNDLWGASNQYPFLGSIDLTGCYIKISDEIVWQGVNSLNLLKNANGHYFYDIADKDAVDEFYQENGEAWFFGIDTTNERIFLPRTTRFQYTSDVSKVGKYQEAGLPNTDGSIDGIFSLLEKSPSGAFTSLNSAYNNAGVAKGSETNYCTINYNASLSSPVYGNSDTVTPSATNMLLYMVVGNTDVESAITDIVDVTTTENDTIPLFTGMYFDFIPNHVSWLKAGQQANSGSVYTTAYNTLVSELTKPTYGLKVIDVDDMESDVDYSEYWKVDQDAMTFTTPTRTAERVLVAKKEATAQDPTWFNWYSDGWLEQGGSIEVTTSGSVSLIKPFSSVNYSAFATVEGATQSYTCSVVINSTSEITVQSGTASSSTKLWQTSGYGAIPQLSDYTEDLKLYFKVNNAVQNLQLLDAGEVTEALADKIGRTECKAYITETYTNGTSWYRVYSDGWCEQGGEIREMAVNEQRTVNFLKPYLSTNYYPLTTPQRDSSSSGGGANNPVYFVFEKQPSYMVIDLNTTNNASTYVTASTWQTSGYIS